MRDFEVSTVQKWHGWGAQRLFLLTQTKSFRSAASVRQSNPDHKMVSSKRKIGKCVWGKIIVI